MWVGFFEKKKSAKNQSWVRSPSDARLYWEKWVLRVAVVDVPLKRDKVRAQVERSLAEVIMHVNTKREHVPPIQTHSTKTALPFHFDVVVPKRAPSLLSSSLKGIRRLLTQTSPPPSLLT